MRVAFIKNSKSRGYTVVGIADGDEKQVYTVPDGTYAEMGSPTRGEEIDCGTLELIKHCDECYRAKQTALKLLSYADNNERTLTAKLIRRGIGRDIAKQTVCEMVSLGYINESRQLERLIMREANEALSGPKKIIPKLMAKGYSRSDIDRAVARLCESGKVDFCENRARLIEKNVTRGATEDKIKEILFKKGYSVTE